MSTMARALRARPDRHLTDAKRTVDAFMFCSEHDYYVYVSQYYNGQLAAWSPVRVCTHLALRAPGEYVHSLYTVRHGLYQAWDEHGRPVENGWYRNDQRHGPYEFYRDRYTFHCFYQHGKLRYFHVSREGIHVFSFVYARRSGLKSMHFWDMGGALVCRGYRPHGHAPVEWEGTVLPLFEEFFHMHRRGHFEYVLNHLR